MDDVYDRLKALKAHDESFSDTLRRVTDTKGSILEFAGAWSDMTDEEAARYKQRIASMRKGTRLQEVLKKFRE